MRDFTWEKLQACGFTGGVTPAQLYGGRALELVPEKPGVYVVTIGACAMAPPKFVIPGTGGHFKGKDPNVPVDLLREKWVDDTEVLYFGQTSKKTLKIRIELLVKFGHREAVGHWGGRYLWQLAGAQNGLRIGWCPTPGLEPEKVENWLLDCFEKRYGKKVWPFANLRGPTKKGKTPLPGCTCD